MKTRRSRIASTVADQLLAGGNEKQISQQIAAYLLTERRVGELDSLMRDVQVKWAQAGHVEVLAASAFPLSTGVKANITAQVKQMYPDAKKIVVTEVHDPTVIGGVKVTSADKQLDLSIEAKLNKFKQLTTAGKE